MRTAIGCSLVIGLLAGCVGSQIVPSSTGGVPAWEATHAARRACPHAPRGRAECLALIESARVNPLVAGWTPAAFQARYKLPSGSKGAGQVVAIVDAYDNPDVASDLAQYRSEFNLGTAEFYKYNQDGDQGGYPAGSQGWGVEIDLDAEMVSATCPQCTIYLVEANSSDGSDLEAAEVEAVKLGAHIVTNSWICYDSISCVDSRDFAHKGVEYLAATGDEGYDEPGAPSAFDSVAAIGGTVLSQCGSQYCETPWADAGGGCDTGVKKPKWQHDKVCAGRAAADASAVAWNVAEYDSYGESGWFEVGGTSVAAPLLAGVFGLAGNAARQEGGRTFWQRAHHADLYDICSPCLFKTYGYQTGWGSPDGLGAF